MIYQKVMISVKKDLLEIIILLVIAIVFMLIYVTYVIIDERNGIKESFLSIHFIMKLIIFYIWIWL